MEILLETSRFTIVNKASGLHSDTGMTRSIIDELDKLVKSKNSLRACHRLDLETSGCLLLAHPDYYGSYHKLFKDPKSTLQKTYLAGASAPLKNSNLNQEIQGWVLSRYRRSKKLSFSYTEPLKKWHSQQKARHRCQPCLDKTVVQELEYKSQHPYWVQLITGTRHQIRCFFAAEGAPLLGDTLYGAPPSNNSSKIELHAYSLEFIDPIDGEKIYVCAKKRPRTELERKTKQFF